MLSLVEAKQKEFKENFPKNLEFKSWFSKSNLWGWVYSAFVVQGQAISKPAIVDLVEGTLRYTVPLSCYSFVSAFKSIYADMLEENMMQSSPSTKLYLRWASLLGCEEFRKSNPVVYELGLIPCHFYSINQELDYAFKRYATSELNPLEAATILFLDLIKIYPYEDESIDMALIMLMYCFIQNNYPVPELGLTQKEFNKYISLYMDDKEEYGEFYNHLLKQLYNRLDSVVLFEKQALEQEK